MSAAYICTVPPSLLFAFTLVYSLCVSVLYSSPIVFLLRIRETCIDVFPHSLSLLFTFRTLQLRVLANFALFRIQFLPSPRILLLAMARGFREGRGQPRLTQCALPFLTYSPFSQTLPTRGLIQNKSKKPARGGAIAPCVRGAYVSSYLVNCK